MLITVILIIGLLLSFKKWSSYFLTTITLPFFPFVIAFNIRKERPVMAYSLITIWSIFYTVILLISFLAL